MTDLTTQQFAVLEVLIERRRLGRGLTIMGVVNVTGLSTGMVDRAFRELGAKGYLAVVEGPHHRLVKDIEGRRVDLPTYRRIAEDGVEVTQCPAMPARGYGLHGIDQDW